MTARKEFSAGVKIAAKARATVNGILFCEGCGQPVKEPVRIDHIRAAGLYGSSKLENAQCLGKCCWVEKDAADGLVVKRSARIEVRHQGIASAPKMQSRGFASRPPKPSPSRRPSKSLPYKSLAKE